MDEDGAVVFLTTTRPKQEILSDRSDCHGILASHCTYSFALTLSTARLRPEFLILPPVKILCFGGLLRFSIQ
jgi:hypothetical protein